VKYNAVDFPKFCILFRIQGKNKAVPLHALKKYGRVELWFHLFLISMLDKMSGQSYAPGAFLPLPIEETGWPPKPVWISGDEIKNSCNGRESNPGFSNP
jgi:hypothetical protein